MNWVPFTEEQKTDRGILNFDLSAIVPTPVEAEKFIESIELKCWDKLRNIPSRSRPDMSYPDEWAGWPDFLGYSKYPGRDWWLFQPARAWVHKLELWRFRPQGGGQRSWKEYCAGRIPSLPPRPENDIPTAPDQIYADSGWKGFHDWVGSPQTNQNPRTKT